MDGAFLTPLLVGSAQVAASASSAWMASTYEMLQRSLPFDHVIDGTLSVRLNSPNVITAIFGVEVSNLHRRFKQRAYYHRAGTGVGF